MIKGHHILNAITAAMIAALPLLTSSCIYDDDEPDIKVGEPTMLARFIISVGNDQEGSTIRTKQTAAVTQAQSTPVFRGMQDIAMIPFGISSTSTQVSTTDNRIFFNITLPATGSIPQAPANNTIASLNATSQSQVYQDITIAMGTNAFLCYGKATGEDNMTNGSLVCTGLETGNPGDISFSPKAIYTTETPTTAPAEATAIATYLSDIANTTGWESTTNVKMQLLRERFLSQHAGSAANVLATLQKLYDAIVHEVSTLRDNIIASMNIGSDANNKLTLTNGTLAWNDAVTFKSYPASVGLPDGAAYIAWSGGVNQCFIAVINGSFDNVDNRPQGTDPETFAKGTEVDILHYATPAPLYYRANTRIKVSNDSKLALYQDNTKDWDDVLSGYETNDGEVTHETRSIALKDPLQYAVARLDAAVVATSETLPDKDGVLTNAAELELTGVLVNGQYTVDFEFNPITTGTPKPYIIYDNSINPATPATPITLATNIGKTEANYIVNHTLLLQSEEDKPVNIYLELKNNSNHDITTQTGLVPPGCKLYLAGTITLDPAQNQHYVFEQDKKTSFVARISTLQNASNVVPSMDVGLTFIAQVAVNAWDVISTENHPIYNW